MRLTRIRPTRAIFSVGIVGAGLWGLSPSLTVTPSIDSVVNAEVVVVRSVTEGRIEGGPPAVGYQVSEGAPLVRVVNPRQDQSFLGELETEQASLTQRIDALDRQKAVLEDTAAELNRRIETYRRSVKDNLRYRIAEARSELAAIDASLQNARKKHERNSVLVSKNLVARAEADAAGFEFDRLKAESLAAESRIEELNTRVVALDAGVFLSEGQNDVPYSQQRLDEITIRLSDIEARRSEYAMRINKVTRQIRDERVRLSATRDVVHEAPVEGIVWKRFVKPGNDVVIGTELAEIVDCRSVFLDATFDENRFPDIQVGERAKVRFVGEKTEFEATVRAIRGSGAVTDDRLLAARTETRGPKEFQAILEFDPTALGAAAENFCLIGRAAEIAFPNKFATEGLIRVERFIEEVANNLLLSSSYADDGESS